MPFGWLIVVRRASSVPKRKVVLLAVAVLVIEWAVLFGDCTALFGERIRPGHYDQMCNNVPPYIWLPITMAVAFSVSWMVATRCGD